MEASPGRSPGQVQLGGREALAELRVAVFSDAIPGRNGVGTYYDDLVQHLGEIVGEIVMISPPNGGDTLGFPRSIPLPGDSTQRLFFPQTRALWRGMKRFAPHLIVSATPGPYGFLGLVAAARTRAGFCFGVHTQFDQLAGLYWRRPFGRIFQWALALCDRLMFLRARPVLVHNESLRRKVRERGVEDVLLVGTPTCKAFISHPVSPITGSVSSVAFIGRLAPEKRLDQVMECARTFPDVQFRIAGDGPLRKQVDGWAREESNVESLGWVDREQVLKVLDTVQVLVLPSSYETFGSIALEAMARQRIALVSPQCGISRWPDLAEGLVVMHEGERLAEALGRVRAMSAEERRERARRARVAAEDLSRRTIADWVSVIERGARTDLAC